MRMNPSEVIVAYAITGATLLLLLAIGLVLILGNGKGAMLIAGYNTMRKEKREKYDTKALSRFVGWLCIAMIPCMLLTLVGAHFELGWLIGGGTAVSIVLPIGAVIYANTGGRFKKGE